MKIRNVKSIIVILVYAGINAGIIGLSYLQLAADAQIQGTAQELAPEFSQIEELQYFHLKSGNPQMSLQAEKMRSQGDELAEFTLPRGLYQQKADTAIHYQAALGSYHKDRELLILNQQVKLNTSESEYGADHLKYFFKKDLMTAKGNIKFKGQDPKSRDLLHITADTMRAQPEARLSRFTGKVKGKLQRHKKYEGAMDFASHKMHLNGLTSLAHLEGEVLLHRDSYRITAQKADIHLENFNKKLKYFVLNDDVKVRETVETAKGIVERRAYAERLEGFGRDQRMVLSGAPRVEQGEDVIKGYRITIRENVDLIEVDDAMSDVKLKRNQKLKE